MRTMQFDSQYATGMSRQNIEQALIAAGKDLSNIQAEDLSPVEDFHTLARIATTQLAELAEIGSHDEVLDAGSGIGGTARFLAGKYGCRVTTIDLVEEYCETSRWLNQLVALDDRISVLQGDVTNLPFDGASFDVVTSQHVQMNVADEARLYADARRVIITEGRLAIWDVTVGNPGELDYPLPWADRPLLSHLVSADQLRALVEDAGLTVAHWNDLTEQAAPFMEAWLAAPAGPLGLHTFIDNFSEKATDLTRSLADGRLRVIQVVAEATT